MKSFKKSFWNRLKKKNEQAFAVFFNHYYPKLLVYAFKMTSIRADSEDLVQETMTSFWMNVQNLTPTKAIMESYLIRILKNKTIDYFRKKKKIFLKSVDASYLEITFKQHYKIEEEELHNQIVSILNSLPDKTQEIFSLSRNEELTYTQISQNKSISVKTVEAHISKALKELRNGLKEYLY